MAPFKPRASLIRKSSSLSNLKDKSEAIDFSANDFPFPTANLGDAFGKIRFNDREGQLEIGLPHYSVYPFI